MGDCQSDNSQYWGQQQEPARKTTEVPTVPTLAYLRSVVIHARMWPAHDADSIPPALIETARIYHAAMVDAAK